MSGTSTPPVGTQEERDIDSRLDAAIAKSSALIEEAMAQLAMPCIAEEDEVLSPIDLAISRSSLLISEARTQLASPTLETLELTEAEIAENKSAEAWMQTNYQIEQMNSVRYEAGQDLLRSLLQDIEEVDESGELLDPLAQPEGTDFVQSSASYREEQRAKRRSRVCLGPKVAAVVASIEALDEEAAGNQSHKHSRNSSVRSFGK